MYHPILRHDLELTFLARRCRSASGRRARYPEIRISYYPRFRIVGQVCRVKRAFGSRGKLRLESWIARKYPETTYLSDSSIPGDEAPDEWPDLLLSGIFGYISSTWLAVRTVPSSKIVYPSSVLSIPRQNMANDSELVGDFAFTQFFQPYASASPSANWEMPHARLWVSSCKIKL